MRTPGVSSGSLEALSEAPAVALADAFEDFFGKCGPMFEVSEGSMCMRGARLGTANAMGSCLALEVSARSACLGGLLERSRGLGVGVGVGIGVCLGVDIGVSLGVDAGLG